RNIIGGRSETVYLQAKDRARLGVRVIAAGRAAVAGGDGHRDSLRCSLFPEVEVFEVTALSLICLTKPEAHVEDVDLVVVERALNGQIQSRLEGSVLRGVERQSRIGRDGAGNFKVQERLHFIATPGARIVTIDDNRGGNSRQSEETAVIRDVAESDVGMAGNADGDTRAGEIQAAGVVLVQCGIRRVVDGRGVGRGEEVIVSSGATRDSEIRPASAWRDRHRF